MTRSLLALALLAAPIAAFADTDGLWPRLTRDAEIEVALSAAPEHLRAGAAVYVLGTGGFEKVRDSTNGFSCLAIRVGQVFAPTCYDAEGSRTTLRADLRRGELAASGIPSGDVQQTLAAEYESGALTAPQRPGVAYMLSEDFFRVDPETGERATVFPPHVMFYAPYLTNDDIGALPEHVNSHTHPWVLGAGSPTACVIVVPPEHVPES